MKKDIQLEMFKKFVPYLRGALWWAQNDLIKDRQSNLIRVMIVSGILYCL